MKIIESKIFKVILFVIIALLVILAFIIFFILNSDTIYSGIKVNNLEVEGLNRNEAILLLRSKMDKQLNNKQLILQYNDFTYHVNYRILGAKYDYYKAIDEVHSIGRRGNLIKRLTEILEVRKDGFNYEMNLTYDRNKVYLLISRIAKDINQESKDAMIEYKNKEFFITPEVNGRKINNEILVARIDDALYNMKTVEIPVEKVKALITKDLLSYIDGDIGTFITYFNKNNEDRTNNIILACKAIDSKIILSGETFSFNSVVGPRNKDVGYKEAEVIVNGELVPAVGGGVCQVSTTLYNAALLSDLEIVERFHHSIPSTYVEKGLDATVAYDYLDLKLRNNSEHPVYLHARVLENRLSIIIFGNKNKDNREIKIKTDIIETVEPDIELSIDKSLEPGEEIVVQEGRRGYKVKTYKVIYEKGKILNKELISSDFYKPKKYILKVGEYSKDSTKDEDRNIEN